ncbi:Putative ribonuclease H protein At1g65750 [Linum perenne]
MSQDGSCHRCPGAVEDLLHVLRDCNLAREVWTKLFPHSVVTNFFSDGIHDWLRHGLQQPDSCLIFGTAIWLIWKARNEAVFEHTSMTSDQLRLRVLHWIAGVRETMRANSLTLSETTRHKEQLSVQWKPAPEGFVTLNTDGSVLAQTGNAAAGGIIRDWLGRPLAVFAANLGACMIMRAELRAADIRLKIAWDLGFRNIHLQLDSKSAVKAISKQGDEPTRHGQSIKNVQDMLARDWNVTTYHIFREGNMVADRFAHLGHSFNFGTFVNCVYPPEIDTIIWNDFIGTCFPRLIFQNE